MILEALKKLAEPIDAVRPRKKNARKHATLDLEAIKKSLSRFGQHKPIIANKQTKHILAGEGRWKAAKELGWKKIAVFWLDLNPKNEEGLSILDNRIAELSRWNQENLGGSLRMLLEDDFERFAATGFTDFEAARLISSDFGEPEGEGTTKTSTDAEQKDDGEPEPTAEGRHIQLFYSKAEHQKFHELINQLEKKWETVGIKETFLRALDEADFSKIENVKT